MTCAAGAVANAASGSRASFPHATVGDENDVDAVALWTHVVARCGFAVQGSGLLLVDPLCLPRPRLPCQPVSRGRPAVRTLPAPGGSVAGHHAPLRTRCRTASHPRPWSEQHFLADGQGSDPRRAFAETLLSALDPSVDRTVQSVYALMKKPGQRIEVRQTCRYALQSHGQRVTLVLRPLLALFEQFSPCDTGSDSAPTPPSRPG